MNDDTSGSSERSVQTVRGHAEAELAATLVARFSPTALYRFIRHQVSARLADALPGPTGLSRDEYAAIVAERVMDFEVKGIVLAALKDKPDEQADIHEREPRYGNETAHRLARDLDDALRRKAELEALDVDTADVMQEIIQIKRAMRTGGQIKPGDRLGQDGRYQLLKRLGRGGFATVWRARDHRDGHDVAIKVLHTELARDATRRERFFRGARLMAQLNHESVVKVLESSGEDDCWLYFVMELVTGGTLEEAVLARRFPRHHAVPLIELVAEALAEAHSRGYVHRDIKPSNILLTETGEPKLTDFDLIAAAETSGGTRTGAMGTFVYAAPEQLDRPQDVDACADVYSLAMTLLFVLYGKRLPLTVMRDTESIVHALECDTKVKDTLLRALDWDPRARFSDAAALARTLARCHDHATAEPTIDLSLLWSVLEGQAAPTFDYADVRAKLLRIFLSAPADIRIRERSFSVQWYGSNPRGYVLHGALPVLYELMTRARVARITMDMVAGMPSAPVPGGSRLEGFQIPDYIVWFIRREDGVDILTRDPSQMGLPLKSGPIPANGPFVLPAPLPSRPKRTHRDFPEGLACPHCRSLSDRYRVIGGGALVCQACGRSFDRP